MSAINWLISKSEYTVLEDGTVSFFFSGSISASMKRQIISAATSDRGSNNASTYNDSGDTFGWAATFGARKSTQFNLTFTYTDYTIPAGMVAA